ncbi:MAG TPA: Ig-like domain-containing protein [Edaphobacter sp.]
MSERIYRVLLRLYPGRFRRSYGEEALQLFRDRMADEKGLLRRSRLWLDLLFDLGAIRIRGYHESAIVGAVVSVERGPGIPSFAILEDQALETRFLVWGGFLSLLLCGAVMFALQHRAGRLPFTQEAFDQKAFYAKPKVIPKIVFSYEPSNASAGSVVRLHADVSGAGYGLLPTGNVNFLYGWSIFASGTLVDGRVTVEAKMPKGKRLPLNALYLGDSNYGSASSMEKKP